MPGYYRSSPDHQEGQPPQRRRSAPHGRRRFGFPSLPVLNPRTLAKPAPRAQEHPSPGATAAAVGRPAHTTTRQRLRRWARLLAGHRWRERAWNLSHAGAGLLLILGLACLAFVFTDLGFYVYAADVQNTRYASPAAIYQQAGIDGFSAFFVQSAEVSERVRQLPTVQSAVVRVSLPNQVAIEVAEREPVLLYQVQAETYWVDAQGMMMPAADARGDLVKLIDDALAAQMDSRRIDPSLLHAIQQITRDLPQIDTFRYQEPFGMYFFSPEGWRVLLGEAEAMDSKLSTWTALRQDLLRKKAAVQEVDLRFQHPYWR